MEGYVSIGIIAYYDTTITNRDDIYHFSSLGVFVIFSYNYHCKGRW